MANHEERSSIGGRLRRYAQVTGTMSSLAARLAGERYLGLELDRSKHAIQLRDIYATQCQKFKPRSHRPQRI